MTSAGEIFLSQARHILSTYHDTVTRCREASTVLAGKLRIAAPQSLYLTQYLWHLERHLDPQMTERNLKSPSWSSDQYITALQQKYCDLVLLYWHPEMRHAEELDKGEFEHISLAHDRLIAVTSTKPSIPIAAGSPSPFSPGPVLGYCSTSSLSSLVDQLICRHFPQIGVEEVNRAGRAVGVKALIMEGFGVGWLPKAMCQKELDCGQLRQIGDDRFSAQLEIRLYRRRANTKESLSRLWQLLQSEAKERSNVFPLSRNA